MKFSAEKRTSKWPCGRSSGGMVTIVAVLLAVGIPVMPAAARQSGFFPWDGLFGDHRPRPRKATHRAVPSAPPQALAPAAAAPAAPILASVPLPKPRPDEAPARAPDKAEAEK